MICSVVSGGVSGEWRGQWWVVMLQHAVVDRASWLFLEVLCSCLSLSLCV